MGETVQNRPWYQSGWAIVLGLAFCWPLGLLFALLRLRSDRSFHSLAATLLRLVGYILLIGCSVGLVGLIVDLRDTADVDSSLGAIVWAAIFAAGGIVLLKKGSQILAGIKRRKVLINQIVNERLNSIDEIASRIRQPVGEVLYDVLEMARSGFLPGYQVDTQGRRVWRPILAPTAAEAVAVSGKAPEFLQFTCKGCGAHNQVQKSGQRVVCEFCDVAVAV
jgi:hypothetical protein